MSFCNGGKFYRKVHLNLCQGILIIIPLRLTIQLHIELHRTGLSPFQRIQIKERIQRVRRLMQSFQIRRVILAADGLAVVERLGFPLCIRVSQNIAVRTARRGFAGIFQRFEHLVGHVPVCHRIIAVVYRHAELRTVPGLHVVQYIIKI